MSYRRGLIQAFLFLSLLFASTASAQSVSVWISADPDPFDIEETIEVVLQYSYFGPWWSCPIESYCYGVYIDAEVYASDGYYDYDYGEGGIDGWGDFYFYDDWASMYMEETSYSGSVTVWFYDYEWDEWVDEWDYDSTTIEPVAPTISSNAGNTIWWFSGESPSGYTMQIS